MKDLHKTINYYKAVGVDELEKEKADLLAVIMITSPERNAKAFLDTAKELRIILQAESYLKVDECISKGGELT